MTIFDIKIVILMNSKLNLIESIILLIKQTRVLFKFSIINPYFNKALLDKIISRKQSNIKHLRISTIIENLQLDFFCKQCIYRHKMNILEQNLLKKSLSQYKRNQQYKSYNPEQQTPKSNKKSHLQELILQKYNFHSRLKTQNNQNPIKKRSINTTPQTPWSNMVLLSQLPKIQNVLTMSSQISLQEKQLKNDERIRKTAEVCAYNAVNFQKRKFSEYKNCMKRIQMTTTYRGFNLSKQKFYRNKNKQSMYLHQNQNPNLSQVKYEDQIRGKFKAAQRKRIISYIIQRGFAKKKEDELMKIKNEKRKMHEQFTLAKNTKAISPFKMKRSVVFSHGSAAYTESEDKSQKNQLRDQQIQPW